MNARPFEQTERQCGPPLTEFLYEGLKVKDADLPYVRRVLLQLADHVLPQKSRPAGHQHHIPRHLSSLRLRRWRDLVTVMLHRSCWKNLWHHGTLAARTQLLYTSSAHASVVSGTMHLLP